MKEGTREWTRVHLRETGSILVTAPRDRVYEILRREMTDQPGLRDQPGHRLDAEAAGGARTWVLRDEAGGTRVIHARSRSATILPAAGPRDELRAAVEAELLRVRRMVDES